MADRDAYKHRALEAERQLLHAKARLREVEAENAALQSAVTQAAAIANQHRGNAGRIGNACVCLGCQMLAVLTGSAETPPAEGDRPAVAGCTHPSVRVVWEAMHSGDVTTKECLRCMYVWTVPFLSPAAEPTPVGMLTTVPQHRYDPEPVSTTADAPCRFCRQGSRAMVHATLIQTNHQREAAPGPQTHEYVVGTYSMHGYECRDCGRLRADPIHRTPTELQDPVEVEVHEFVDGYKFLGRDRCSRIYHAGGDYYPECGRPQRDAVHQQADAPPGDSSET